MTKPNPVKQGDSINSSHWLPGQSGNPNGRPKRTYTITTMLQELANGNYDDVLARWHKAGKLTGAQEYAIALHKLAAKGDKGAIHEIVDRTEGKASQPIEVPDPIEHSVKMVIERVGNSDKTSDK